MRHEQRRLTVRQKASLTLSDLCVWDDIGCGRVVRVIDVRLSDGACYIEYVGYKGKEKSWVYVGYEHDQLLVRQSMLSVDSISCPCVCVCERAGVCMSISPQAEQFALSISPESRCCNCAICDHLRFDSAGDKRDNSQSR